MAKNKPEAPKAGKEKLERLPSARNGRRRKAASFGVWGYEKESLRREARAAGMTLSCYVNRKLLLP